MGVLELKVFGGSAGALLYRASRIKEWSWEMVPKPENVYDGSGKGLARGDARVLGAWRALAACGWCPGGDSVLEESKSPLDQLLRESGPPQTHQGPLVLSSQHTGSYGRTLQNFWWH